MYELTIFIKIQQAAGAHHFTHFIVLLLFPKISFCTIVIPSYEHIRPSNTLTLHHFYKKT